MNCKTEISVISYHLQGWAGFIEDPEIPKKNRSIDRYWSSTPWPSGKGIDIPGLRSSLLRFSPNSSDAMADRIHLEVLTTDNCHWPIGTWLLNKRSLNGEYLDICRVTCRLGDLNVFVPWLSQSIIWPEYPYTFSRSIRLRPFLEPGICARPWKAT